MVTAEVAAVLPTLVLFILSGLACVSLVIDQLKCFDAAREGARAAARGDPPDVAGALALRIAPAGAQVTAADDGGVVTFRVTVRRRSMGLLWPVQVGGQSVAAREPDPVPPP